MRALQPTRIDDLRPTRDKPYTLSHFMEFDFVIEVHADGFVTRSDEWAPELRWLTAEGTHELDTDDWELMSGYSGQYRYAGPIMHPSEFIGGGMADDILDEPGLYVALVCYPMCDDDCEYGCADGEDCEPDGWAVARKDT